MERAFEIIKAFNEGPQTTTTIRKRLGVCRQVAQRWIDQASRYYPIVESDERWRSGDKGGCPAKVYYLMGGKNGKSNRAN